MPRHLIEFLLKGFYLGLLVALALRHPDWTEIGLAAAFILAGLTASLGTVAINKIREGYQIKGKTFAFLLFLILENPRRVYAGVIIGLLLGIFIPPFFTGSHETRTDPWAVTLPMLGGLVLGVLFWFFRHVRDKNVRRWIGLALSALLMLGAVAPFFFQLTNLTSDQEVKFGWILLLGIPGFYLLTFCSLVEESEIEIAAICGAMGVGLFLLNARSHVSLAFLAVPLLIYYLYTRQILPGLRVFKHALRGLSYARVGQHRLALLSLNRALQLDPKHALAREQVWYVHRQLEVNQLKNDPETLALVNYELCLERVAALLLLEKPSAAQLSEAERLLELTADQRPDLEPRCAYWRAVAELHRHKIDEAARDLESVLRPAENDSPQRHGILFQAWQLALVLHPQMRQRVGDPMLTQPGRRMEAIAAVERRLAMTTPDNPDAWTLKRLLYSELTEAEYNAAPPRGPGEFDPAYVQQLGLALIDTPTRWQRGCEFLRIAAHGQPRSAPAIFLQIGKVHEAHGDVEGLWLSYRQAMHAGRQAGVANLSAEDRQSLFTAVKQLGERAKEQNKLDEALEAFKFYTQYEKAGLLETYRTLADLFERKAAQLPETDPENQQNIWLALHCAEHALTYDGNDADLKARKDRYYVSIKPEEVTKRWESIRLWFDVDYCLQKTRWLLDHYNGDLDLLDWAEHLANIAQAAHPASLSTRLIRGRIRRIRGEMAEATALFEEIRQNKPEKFASDDEETSFYQAHRILGDLYLDEKPEEALQCYQIFRKSDLAGADTYFKMGKAFESLGDKARAKTCYEQVTIYPQHPLYYEARAGLDRLKGA